MCGIAGLFDPRLPPGLAALATAMASAMPHRGPDAGGVWEDPAAGIALAHRRLAILDLSPGGAQPMADAAGRGCVTFNGELYNHHDLRAELAAGGWAFRSRSDTEVLLAACLTWGVPAALPRLRGMFAFAFWDGAARTLWLARDRMGEKPLYWGRVGGALAFASELKALRSLPDWRGSLDPDALAEYFALGYVPSPRSIHPGIAKLPPGSWLRMAADGSTSGPQAWWSIADVARHGCAHPFAGSAEDAADELDRLLASALRGQMEADVPLGAFLSGGIDSSAVVGAMQALSSRPVRTCTIAFGDAEFDESAHAAAVGAHLGTDHLTLQAAPEDALALVPGLPHIWDEPFADSSQIPTALVCRLARRHVSVALSGDGGDELFAGYVRHVRGPGLWRRLRLTPRPLRWLLANGLRAWPAQAAWLARRAGLREAQLPNKLATLAACLDSAGEAGLYRAMTGLWRHRMPAAGRHPPLADSGLPDLRSRLQLWDQQGYLPDDILVKVDRAAMAASLETRVPLLDERIIAFAWSLPDRLRVANGQGKPILRRVAERRLPPGLLARPKRGFAIPLAAWLRGPLRGWAEELLVPARLADLPLDQADITTSWRRLLAGRQGDEHGLWAVLMLQAWRSTAR